MKTERNNYNKILPSGKYKQNRKLTDEGIKFLYKNIFGLLDNSPFAVAILNSDHKTNYLSPKFTELFGFSLKEIPDLKALLKIISENSNEKSGSFMTWILGNGKKRKNSFTGLFTQFDKSKNKKNVRLTAVESEFNNKFIFFEDITERVNYEETIKESEEKFRSIVENSHAGIIIIGGDFLFNYVNEQFCKMIGYSSSELIGKDFRNYLDESSKILVAETYKKRQKGEKVPSEYTFQIVTKEGVIKSVQISSVVAKSKNGVIKTYAQLLDITEQVRAEVKLIESERKYMNLFESAGDSIFIMKDNLFIDCNEQTLKLFACNRSQIIGKPPYKFSPPKQYDGASSKKKSLKILTDAYRGIPQHFEWLHKKFTGEIFDAEVSLSKVETGGEKLLQAIVRDISERKKSERALEQRSRVEKIISEISSTFINIPIDKIDSNIVLSIKKIVNLTSSDQGVLFILSDDGLSMRMTHSWSKSSKNERQKETVLELKNLKWWSKQILNKKTVAVSRLDDLPQEAEFEKSFFTQLGIFSIIDIPLIYQKKVIGLLGFNSKKKNLEFNHEDIILLNMLGQIFVNAIQRKKTELNLLESEKRLELAINGANLGLWDWEIQTGKITYNENWAKINGYKFTETKSQFESWQNLIHNEDYKRIRTSLNDHLKGRTEFYESEYRIKTKSGQWKWILDKGKVFERDKYGKALRAAGTTLDITDKKNAEEALIQSEERFRSLFENSAFGIYQTSIDGKIELCNNSFLEIFGYETFDQIKDAEISKSFYISSKEREKFLSDLYKERKINGYETEYKNAKGKKVYVREYARIVNVKGRSLIEGAVEDITKSKLAELELVKAKEKAEESDKLKSEFLAQMSHEIRTPINTVLSFASLLKDELSGKLSIDLEECFSVMNRAGKRIVRTIDLLLDMSQMQTGTYEINLKKIDVWEKILKDITDEYKYTAKEKNLKFDIKKQTENNFILGDEYTIGQIMHNLIDNAVKYTNEGSVNVIVGKDKNNDVYIKIEDTGIGISTEYLPNIFKPFTQEDQGYTRSYEGNGLGLALVKNYCEINNAKISVKSKKGKGTAFTVYFKSNK